MMRLGMFARTFPRATVEETFDAVAAHGLTSVHLNMATAGLDSMPARIEPSLARRVRDVATARGIEIATLSGTFNMIHPDPAVRRRGLDRLAVLAAACDALGTRLITLCTGTRDRENMWRGHPDNDLLEAWSDLIDSMTSAVEIAEWFGVTLGIEPEPGNVVSNAARARRLLDEIDPARLGIVLDPANLIAGISPDQVDAALDEAFALLGERIVSAHGKDRDATGAVRPAGQGIVPWHRVIAGLRATGYDGPLLLHGLEEADVAAAVRALRNATR